MDIANDDPRLTAMALGELDSELADAVRADVTLQERVDAVHKVARRIHGAFLAEPAAVLTRAQRAAVLEPPPSTSPRRWGPPIPPERRRAAWGVAAIAAVVALLVGGSWLRDRKDLTVADRRDGTPTSAATEVAVRGGGRPLLQAEPTPGVLFRLRSADGAPDGEAPAEDARTVAGEPIDSATLDGYVARLPELPATSSVTETFALRPGPQPPAIPGETRQQPWPPPATAEAPPEVAVGPLTVVRAGPIDDVPMATQLTVTFSEPMVPLTSHGEAEKTVPVTLEPALEGKWRWVGTKTLLFEPELRFPMATEYTATIPAGTASATGATVNETYTWTFRTPPPRVVSFHPRPPTKPDGPWTDRQPLIFIEFDQSVDAEAVLGHVAATTGGQAVALRLATPGEIAEDAAVEGMSRSALDGRWVAFRPDSPLAIGSHVQIVLDAELPSAEGPRPMGAEFEFAFEVYHALEIIGLHCDRDDDAYGAPDNAATTIDRCYPSRDWGIRLNNRLDPEAFDATAFSIAPEIPEIVFQPEGARVDIDAFSVGRTTYTVQVPAGLKDIYGQTLPAAAEVTFKTTDAPPALYVPGQDMLVLDPAAEGKLTVAAVNNDKLQVALYRVGPRDWPAYREYHERFMDFLYGRYPRTDQDGNPMPLARPRPPWDPTWTGTVEVDGERDDLAAAIVDLAPALEGGFGQVIVIVEPDGWTPPDPRSGRDGDESNRPHERWVQVTRLGVKYAVDADALVWVTDLATGDPVQGAAVSIEESTPGDASRPITTDRTGLVEGLAVQRVGGQLVEGWQSLVVRSGDDLAMLPIGDDYAYYGDHREKSTSWLWFTFDDRGLYKPGERARIKGWLRPTDWGKGGDLEPPDPQVRSLDYIFSAPNGGEVAKGSVAVTAAGGFDVTLELPLDMELGDAGLVFQVPAGTEPASETYHTIKVAEFRRPEFEVAATAAEPYYFIGDTAFTDVAATYYSGGPLPGAETTWSVSAEPTTYTPPGRDGFTFGRFVPWWSWSPIPYGTGTTEQLTSRTDAEGKHRLAIEIDNVVPLAPASFRAEAYVQDVNRQTWTGTATFLAHPARYYVGLRADRWFAEPGEPLALDTIVADLDGALVGGTPASIVAEQMDWVFRAGEYLEEPIPAGGCELTSADEPVPCTLTFDEGGSYRITATVQDPEGRINVTEMRLWTRGGEAMPLGEGADAARAELIPDTDEYQPGETAHIMVRSPFAPAEGLLTLRRSGIVHTERFRMDEATFTLDVPITEAMLPNIAVHVDLTGMAPRRGPDGEPDTDLPMAPAVASGEIALNVPPLQRTLAVYAVPREAVLAPAELAAVDVTVRGPAGNPVDGAEVVLVVIDESILALTGYEMGDPVAAFNPQRSADVTDATLFDYLWLADPEQLATGMAALRAAGGDQPLAGGGGGGDMVQFFGVDDERFSMQMGLNAADTIEAASLDGAYARTMAAPQSPPTAGGDPAVFERTFLDPLAYFAPRLTTDASGHASAEFALPDSVTRYRIMAVATDGALSFGKGESALTARLPLAVRPSAPRFLNFGDTFDLPIVVQNQTDAALETDVVVRAINLKLDGESGSASLGQRVTVPANDRVEVRFPAGADMPGLTVLQAAVFSGDLTDAQRVTLPVWTPATTEAFATYGEIDEGAAAQPVQRPPDIVEQFGGLEMTLTSTALGNLTDAYLYLQEYPFESSEAVASRLVATVALKDVLLAFGAAGASDPATTDAAVRRDIAKLGTMQNDDGGFGWWGRSQNFDYGKGSPPFATVHVVHAFARARTKGYEAAPYVLEQAKAYLDGIDGRLDAWEIGGESRYALQAYALYVRMLLDDRSTGAARQVFNQEGEREVDTLGWLLAILSGDAGSQTEVDEIRRQLNNKVSEEAATAQFTTNYDEGAASVVLASDRRADAVVLEAMIGDQPESPLIPKLARGLLDHRVKGRWNSTQENAFVLLALDRYFHTYEGVTPDFVAQAWLGDGFVSTSEFRGRSADRSQSNVPFSALAERALTDLVLSKDGPGRLYYRLGLRYAPQSLQLEPSEHGFSVTRSYEAVDDTEDVGRVADGSWRIRAGARVRVRVNMVAESRRYHVALVDPLPAGLEAINPELALGGTVPPPEHSGGDESPWSWWWPWYWFDHQEFRDERTEAFASLLDPGAYLMSYIARATTPGEFVVPPARAEEMYHPETFGRSGTDRVIIVP